MAEKLRLGGMALRNGVLVHGPTSWGCAVRLPDGTLKVASARKRTFRTANPLLRGPLRLLEGLAVLPAVKRKLPEAKLPFEQPRVVGAMVASSVAARLLRDARGLTPLARELASGLVSLGPAVLSLRGGELTSYHGAEHIAIGTYEHDEPRAREHERCGSHLVGPLVVTGAVANVLAQKAPARYRPAAHALGSLGAVAASTELFGWMTRHPDRPLSRLLARPGYEIQHRFATADPSPEQVAVAEAALRACLEREAAA